MTALHIQSSYMFCVLHFLVFVYIILRGVAREVRLVQSAPGDMPEEGDVRRDLKEI